jgi:putative phosphoribosyl transferase
MQSAPEAGLIFRDRRDVGLRLADRLRAHRGPGTAVVAAPRGNVLVAAEVARRLEAPLDVLVVERVAASDDLGHVLGAVAGDRRVLDLSEVQRAGHSTEELETELGTAGSEAGRRERFYRDGRAPVELSNRTVLLVFEGIGSPFLARAAVEAVRFRGPSRLVLATAFCPRAFRLELRQEVDELVVLRETEQVAAVGEWYREFPPVSDDEVRDALASAWTARPRRS